MEIGGRAIIGSSVTLIFSHLVAADRACGAEKPTVGRHDRHLPTTRMVLTFTDGLGLAVAVPRVCLGMTLSTLDIFFCYGVCALRPASSRPYFLVVLGGALVR